MKNKTCFGINIISLTITIFGTIIALIVLIYILLRRKTLYNIQLLLCANNYLLLFILGILTLTINIRIYHGDLKEVNNEKETLSCRMNSYIFYVFMSAVYLAFILQATFRLCRLIYVSRQNLLNFRTYWFIIPLFWLFSFLLNLPLLLWHGQELIPSENACLVPKDDPRSIAYSILIIYGIPFLSIVLVYIRLIQFLRQQSLNRNFSEFKRFRHRDMKIFRRILIVVILLGIYGLPTAIMLLILAFTNELVICFYRILILSVSVCVLTLSLALVYITPQIHLCRQKPRVIPMIKDQKDIPQ
ncbi:unnamed protein product [Adineta ricciae]|uniref:G-protein coupled receptors family 1 profile domain-containing protein n=1 Tax=Adineta ricciae TaxID=249248 RepID=A0A816F3J5_ADIRI|nr:unnamed protein product [Adineta ricciae]CAF1657927.1 unnamed protein product [Adineta ricciae]